MGGIGDGNEQACCRRGRPFVLDMVGGYLLARCVVFCLQVPNGRSLN